MVFHKKEDEQTIDQMFEDISKECEFLTDEKIEALHNKGINAYYTVVAIACDGNIPDIISPETFSDTAHICLHALTNSLAMVHPKHRLKLAKLFAGVLPEMVMTRGELIDKVKDVKGITYDN